MIIFILLSWVLTTVIACIPLTILFLITSGGACDAGLLKNILRVVVFGADSCMVLVSLVYTAVVCMCLKIYAEIRALQHRLSQFRFDQEVKGERNVYFTTLMLLATMTVFFVPYTTVYIISIHQSNWHEMNNSVLIYYMNVLPYLKFLSDPIIYGMRMKEIREGCRRLASLCGCYMYCANTSDSLHSHTMSTRRTSGNGSLQMRSLSYRDREMNGYKWNNVRLA